MKTRPFQNTQHSLCTNVAYDGNFTLPFVAINQLIV